MGKPFLGWLTIFTNFKHADIPFLLASLYTAIYAKDTQAQVQISSHVFITEFILEKCEQSKYPKVFGLSILQIPYNGIFTI